jgi:hypothetical protein
MDDIKRQIDGIAEGKSIRDEMVALRRLVWCLAMQNGGGLTIDCRDLDLVPPGAILEAWREERTDTYHIRATQP